MKRKIVFTLAVVVSSILAVSAQSQTKKIVDNMLATIKKCNGATYVLKQTEKQIGKSGFNYAEMMTKINNGGSSVYSKVLTEPNKGVELLYVKGMNSNKVKVNAGKLLPTLNLTPTSNLLTKDQHHTLLNSGFGFIYRIIADGVRRAEAEGKFDEVFKYEGDVTYAGKNCYKIVTTDPTFKITSVTGKAGDNVYTLASRLLISEYHVLALNGLKSFETDLSNKVIKVPSSYAAKSIIYIDKATNFPVLLEMHDQNGVFEKYEFKDLKINPAFKTDEFTEDFSEYGF